MVHKLKLTAIFSILISAPSKKHRRLLLLPSVVVNVHQLSGVRTEDFWGFQVEKYFDRMRLLKNLLAETKAAFDEINQCGYFDFEDQESPQAMLDNDEINLSEELTKPPSIVILGQDNLAKAAVVKELFGEDYLPLTQVIM